MRTALISLVRVSRSEGLWRTYNQTQILTLSLKIAAIFTVDYLFLDRSVPRSLIC